MRPPTILAPPLPLEAPLSDPSIHSALTALRRGDLPSAGRTALHAARQAASRWDPEAEATGLLVAAESLLADDRAAEALPLLTAASERAVEAGSLRLEAGAFFGSALAHFDLGASKDGHDALLEAMELYRRVADETGSHDDKWRLARAVRVYGEHLGVLGSSADARQALELARIMFQDLSDLAAADAVRADLDELPAWER